MTLSKCCVCIRRQRMTCSKLRWIKNTFRTDTGKYFAFRWEFHSYPHCQIFPFFICIFICKNSITCIFVDIFLLDILYYLTDVIRLRYLVDWLVLYILLDASKYVMFYLYVRNLVARCLTYALWCVTNCFSVKRDKWYTNCCHIISLIHT